MGGLYVVKMLGRPLYAVVFAYRSTSLAWRESNSLTRSLTPSHKNWEFAAHPHPHPRPIGAASGTGRLCFIVRDEIAAYHPFMCMYFHPFIHPSIHVHAFPSPLALVCRLSQSLDVTCITTSSSSSTRRRQSSMGQMSSGVISQQVPITLACLASAYQLNPFITHFRVHIWRVPVFRCKLRDCTISPRSAFGYKVCEWSTIWSHFNST